MLYIDVQEHLQKYKLTSRQNEMCGNAHIIPVKNVRNNSTKMNYVRKFRGRTITVSTFDIKSLFIMNMKYSLACPIKISSRGLGGLIRR